MSAHGLEDRFDYCSRLLKIGDHHAHLLLIGSASSARPHRLGLIATRLAFLISLACLLLTACAAADVTRLPPPSTPANFTATPVAGGVSLTWSASTNTVSYSLYRATASGTEGTTPYQTGLTGTSYTDTGTSSGTTYYYILRSVNADDMSSSPSAEVSAAVTANPAPAVPAYLSNLTLSSASVTGGSSTTGTVTLSSPALANITIALHSNNSAAIVPATCTILANTTQTTFKVTTTAVSAAVLVTLSGSYNSWIQGDDLSVQPSTLPTAPPPGVPVIHVAPGNGCAVVSWNRLADGTVSGYNIYRTSGGTTTLLTPKPFASNFYPDTGLTNNTATYTYQVAAVDTQGKEQALSDPVSAVPASAAATLNWINPPSAVTDRLLMEVSLSSGVQIFGGQYFIDGQQHGGGGSQAPNVNGVQTYTDGAGYDSTRLSNGPHTVQFLGFADADETVAAITAPITVQVSNTISNDSIVGVWFDPTQGELCYLSATVPAGSTWTVQVTPQDGTTVLRTWQGASSFVNLAWDGNDASGKPVPLADYSLLLTVQPPGTSPNTTGAQAAPNATGTVKKTHPTKVLHSQPIALALMSVGASYTKDSNGNVVATPTQDIMLANVVTNAYTTLFGTKDFQVIRSDTFIPDQVVKPGVTVLTQLEGWLGTAQVFYLFGHGAGAYGDSGPTQTSRSTVFGAFDQQQGQHLELFPTATVAFALSGEDVLVPNYVKSNNYVFAWIDSCNSAGGNTVTGKIGTADYVWSQAFNATTFVGDNGFDIINNLGPTGTTYWYKWRSTFWNNLAMGQPITHAYLQCWVVDGKGKGPGGTNISYGTVDLNIYPDTYFLDPVTYGCNPGDGYGGNPRVVLYGEPDITMLTL